MSKRIVSSERRIHLCGILDGFVAMEVVNRLRDRGNREIVLDFLGVEGFEAFSVEVLLR